MAAEWPSLFRAPTARLSPSPRERLQTGSIDSAAYALAAIGPAAREAVPELIQATRRDPGSYVCDPYLHALEAIGPQAREAIPALVEVLIEGWCGQSERLFAAELLGNFGPEARSAVSALEAAHKDDPDPGVRAAALEALKKTTSGGATEVR
jgi:HEAT repeat protein